MPQTESIAARTKKKARKILEKIYNPSMARQAQQILDREKIKSLRQSLGLTMEAAADKARLSGRAQWHSVESGRFGGVTLDTLARVADALGVEPADLLRSPRKP